MEKNLYRIINSILLAVIALLYLGDKIGIGQVAWHHCLCSLVLMAGLAAFCYLKLRGRLLMAVSVAACVGVSWVVIGFERMATFWASYVGGLLGNSDTALEWGILHEIVQVIAVSLGIFLFQLLSEKLFGLKVAVAGLLLGGLFWELFTANNLGHVDVVCTLTYVAIVFIEWTQKHWKKQKGDKKKQYIVWILPFLCIYFLFMLAMPAPEEPYDWQFVKDAYGWLQERYVTISQNIQGRGREDFEMASSGFSEDGRLLGGVMDDGQEVMNIQGQSSLKTNVYLVGKVYDTFTGKQWLQNNESAMEDRLLDAFETAYAIWVYDRENAGNYMHSTKLQISYRYFNTGYLFAPLKAWQVESTLPYENEGGNLLFEDIMSYGTTYDVRFFQINVDHTKFYKLLDAERRQDEAVWRSLQKEYIKKAEDRYTLDDLEKRREEIYSVYGQETVVSPKISDWLENVTEGARTDVEKLKAIEAALADFEYTKTPGKLPEDIASAEEFLDYFVLDSRKGFCSYFASAFVLLARAEGIPARYAEGFCVPVEGEQETVVYSDMAHAWPEAYIDGVGWIPFEPTPGYERIRYTPWEMVDYKTHKPEGSVSSWGDWEEETDDDSVAAEMSDMAEAEQEQQKSNVIRIILFTIVFVAMAGFLIFSLDGYLAKRRYRKWTLEEKIMAELKRNLQLLAMLGYQRADYETLTELEKRAWAVMNYEAEGHEIKLIFLSLYEDVFYGNRPVNEEMLQQVLEEQKYLMEMLKKWKRLMYLYCKILFHNVT